MSLPTPPPSPDTPQVLLFGHSGAGKSAILGALMKAAETQGPTLRGEVLEPSGRLAAIRDAVYRDAPLEPTATELTSYTVRLRPWRDGTRAVTDPLTVVLNDCSGSAAQSLITHPEPIYDARTGVPAARAVIEADAIVLMVDGAADDEQLLEAFEEFDTFLTIVSKAKSNAREVGGLPVLLVLTQCDRLARPDDTLASWEQRVKERADRACDKLEAFLKEADPDDGIPSPFLPFGSVELSVYAVAVRTPQLADQPAQPNAPYQVAELFRDVFEGAKQHRERVRASDLRLKWTVRSALSVVCVLFLSVVAVTVFQPVPTGPELSERIRGYQLHEPEAAIRLSYPALTRNKNALVAFRDDPAFFSVPDDLRRFVLARIKEIDDYERFRERLLTSQAPEDTRTLEELERVEKHLGTDLALPAEYAWGSTAMAELRRKWLADALAIRKAEAENYEKYRDLVRRGTVLAFRPTLAGDWRNEVGTLLAEAATPTAPLTEALPGSPTFEGPRGQPVTRWVPYHFERVDHERKNWDIVRERLLHLRDLGDALGLTAGVGRPEPVFVLPEPGPGVDFGSLPAARMAALLRGYTRESEDYREWNLDNFRDPVYSLLAERLRESFRIGVRHVHGRIRSSMGNDPALKDSPEWWRSLADSLGDPATAYPDWGRFLHLLAKLRDSEARNPVGELASFLRQPSFELNLQGFDLYLPPDLGLQPVTPSGPFTITITPRSGQQIVRSFKQVGRGLRKGAGSSYLFRVEGGGTMTYHPGDELRAELPVRVGAQDCRLVWEATASRTYQFDKLGAEREPRLFKPVGASEPAAGVRLTPTTDSRLPQLPVLFPDVHR